MRLRPALLALVMLLGGCHTAPGLAATRTGGMQALAAKRDAVRTVLEANAPLAQRDAGVIAEKYAKMAETPFSFFRGSAYLYYADARQASALKSAIRIPLQGDLHLENLGTYRTATGAVAYDLNDFDEAFTGPYTWELARFAVSIHLAAPQADADALVAGALSAYYRHLAALDRAALAAPFAPTSGPAARAIAEAAAVSQAEFIDDLTKNGRLKLGKKLRAIDAATAEAIAAAVAGYARTRPEGPAFFTLKESAAKVAGTASMGRYRYVVRLEGPTGSPDDDVMLELKEQAAPAAGGSGRDAAKRVLEAYRRFLPAPDRFLGTVRMGQHDFLVREWQAAKNDVSLEDLDRAGFEAFLDTAALAAARAHARSGKAAAILKEAPRMSPAIAEFARRYAAQVRADHAAFAASR